MRGSFAICANAIRLVLEGYAGIVCRTCVGGFRGGQTLGLGYRGYPDSCESEDMSKEGFSYR